MAQPRDLPRPEEGANRSWDLPKDQGAVDAVESLPTAEGYRVLRERAERLAAEAAADAGTHRQSLESAAECFERLADYPQALAVAQRAADVATAPHDTVRSLLLLGRLYARSGDRDTARASLTDAMTVARRSDDPEGESFALIDLGCLALSIDEDWRTAESSFDRAFRLARAHQCSSAKGHALTAAAAAFVKADDHRRARDLANRGALLYQRTRDVESLGKAYNLVGVSYFADGGRFADAIPFLEIGLEFVASEADLAYVISLLSNNARAYESFYSEPATTFRAPMPGFVATVHSDPVIRLADLTLMRVGWKTTPAIATLQSDPVIAEPVVLLPFPSR